MKQGNHSCSKQEFTACESIKRQNCARELCSPGAILHINGSFYEATMAVAEYKLVFETGPFLDTFLISCLINGY